MRSAFLFGLILAIRMAITAALVIVASVAAEVFGPLIGAMIATLPISAGPTYIFLALDHIAAFIAASALASLVVNAANIAFCAAYTVTAPSRGLAASLATAVATWLGFALLGRAVPWSVPASAALNVAVRAICPPFGRRFCGRAMPVTVRRWYDMPFRAAMVATLVATVVAVSTRVGPTVTGILALYPIVLTTLVLIFHARVGGPATATLTANAIPGLGGYGVALLVLSRAAVPAGMAAALAVALAVSIGWNLAIIGLRRRGPSSPA